MFDFVRKMWRKPTYIERLEQLRRRVQDKHPDRIVQVSVYVTEKEIACELFSVPIGELGFKVAVHWIKNSSDLSDEKVMDNMFFQHEISYWKRENERHLLFT